MEKAKRSFFKRWWTMGQTPEVKHRPMSSAYTMGDAFDYDQGWDCPLLSSGYDKNAVVYRCITLIARNIASVPLMLYDGHQRIVEHPVLEMLNKPNAMQNYTSFCEGLVTYLLLSGNSFIQAVADHDAPHALSELHLLRPTRMHVVPGPDGRVKGYEYRLGNQKYTIDVNVDTGESAILHMKLFNPLDDYLGASPIRSAKSMIDLQNVIVFHNLTLLHNAGCPSGALMLKGNPMLTADQEKQLRDQVHTMKSRAGAGKMLVLNGDFEWKEMGLRPKDMDFNEGRTMAAREIAQVFGVPPMCIGILGDSTYSNYQEARLHLWEDTCLPLFDMILSHFNQWLLPYYGSHLTLSYSKDDIHALIPRREKMWEKVCKINCLTINERREMLGYGPIQGGDTFGVHDPMLNDA
ncbi:MAG: phage portal protein [Alphaproteobacteria bacterium]|nr:phage portal protein [Alphaproteobacteria bacterium]